MPGKILITGATGKVGRHVVAGLLERVADFRTMARDPENVNLSEDVEVVREITREEVYFNTPRSN